MPPRPPQTPDVRRRILDAALGLLHEAGVGALTQPRIARAADVRQSHLTYYFPTRIDLLKAVVQHSMAESMRSLAAFADRGSGASRDRLVRAMGEGVTDSGRARLLLGLIVASDEDRTIKIWLREFIGELRSSLALLPEAAGMDATQIALLHGLLVGTAVLNVARDDEASRRESRKLVRSIVALVSGEAAAKSGAGRRKSRGLPAAARRS